MIAEFVGGAIAAVLALLLYGPGPEHGDEAEALHSVQLVGAGGAAGGTPLPNSKASERQGLIGVAANSSAHRW